MTSSSLNLSILPCQMGQVNALSHVGGLTFPGVGLIPFTCSSTSRVEGSLPTLQCWPAETGSLLRTRGGGRGGPCGEDRLPSPRCAIFSGTHSLCLFSAKSLLLEDFFFFPFLGYICFDFYKKTSLWASLKYHSTFTP